MLYNFPNFSHTLGLFYHNSQKYAKNAPKRIKLCNFSSIYQEEYIIPYSISRKKPIINIVFLRLIFSVRFNKKYMKMCSRFFINVLRSIFTLSSAWDCFNMFYMKNTTFSDTIYVIYI